MHVVERRVEDRRTAERALDLGHRKRTVRQRARLLGEHPRDEIAPRAAACSDAQRHRVEEQPERPIAAGGFRPRVDDEARDHVGLRREEPDEIHVRGGEHAAERHVQLAGDVPRSPPRPRAVSSSRGRSRRARAPRRRRAAAGAERPRLRGGRSRSAARRRRPSPAAPRARSRRSGRSAARRPAATGSRARRDSRSSRRTGASRRSSRRGSRDAR